MKLSMNSNAESRGGAHAESAANLTKSEVEGLGFTTENAENTEDFTLRKVHLAVGSRAISPPFGVFSAFGG